MTDIFITDLHQMSDDAIIQAIGNFIRHHRLERNITQKDLAEQAGINRTTLYELENGGRCTLLTLIQLLRTLDLLQVLSAFKVTPEISPLKLAELEKEKRERASGGKDESPIEPEW